MAELQSRIQHTRSRRKNAAIRPFALMAARVLPAGIVAWFAQRHVGADEAVELAGQLPPAKASAIVDCLSTTYLAEAIQYLEPGRAAGLLGAVSPETTARMAGFLADQRSFSDISALLAYMSPAAITAAVRATHSGQDLLRIAVHVQHKHLLSPAIASLPTRRLPALFTAAERGGHWQSVFDIVDAMEPRIQRQLGERLADLKASEITGFLRASLQLNTWQQLLCIFHELSENARQRLGKLIADQDDSLHLDFMMAAHERGDMQSMLKLVSYMPLDDQRRLVRMAGKHGVRITSVL